MPLGSSQADRKDIVPVLGDSLSDVGDTAPAELPVSRRRYAPSSGFFFYQHRYHTRPSLTALPEEDSRRPGAHSNAAALPPSVWRGSISIIGSPSVEGSQVWDLRPSTAITGWGEGEEGHP